MEESIFKDWKERCSSLGHLMTNLQTKEDKQKLKDDIKILENERDLGINVNGNKVKWTDNKIESLNKLKEKLNADDELSSGIKTHLDDVFRAVYWNRSRMLSNKYLEKGNIMEEDALQLVSDVDNEFYIKNKDLLQNDYIIGTPDNKQDIIRDTKCNWDMTTFDKAELTSLYEWQIKAYAWLDDKTEGELCYTLVNCTYNQLDKAKRDLYYQLGCPDDDDEKYLEGLKQIERNMIFDVAAFKRDYPYYTFENDGDFSIPPPFRVKKFQVTLTDEDIENMKRRVLLARKYLIAKEQEAKQILKQWNDKILNKAS